PTEGHTSVGRGRSKTSGPCRRSLVCPGSRHHTAPVRLWSLVLLCLTACEAAPPWSAHPAKPREIAPAVLFVGPPGPAGATPDGSAGKPFATIGEAVRAAPAGALVRIAEGTYAETLVLEKAAV